MKQGIHVINLNAMFHGSPAYTDCRYGKCNGNKSDVLGQVQWAWLDEELQRTAEILVITSVIQVITPTNQYDGMLAKYCLYDGPGNTFDDDIRSHGESLAWKGATMLFWRRDGDGTEEQTRRFGTGGGRPGPHPRR